MSETIIERVKELRERLRERVQEITARVRRPLLGQKSLLRGSEGQILGPEGLIGGGKVIEHVTKAVDNVLEALSERRPNIIPAVMEKIKTWEPGKRLKELIPKTSEEGTQTPSAGTTTTTGVTKKEYKLLRE